jgi:hypothetical protein
VAMQRRVYSALLVLEMPVGLVAVLAWPKMTLSPPGSRSRP